MRFDPKTEEEVAYALPPGEYDFEVVSAKPAVSKRSGAEMIELSLKVYGPGRHVMVRDYLLESVAAKLRHFCGTTGLMGLYDSGTLDAQACEGRSGTVRLRKKEDDFGVKNEVGDYVVSKSAANGAPPREPLGTGKRHSAPSTANATGEVADSDIPF